MPILDGIRSYLFVPASNPRRVDKALASAAHAVVLDLEDAVAPEAKDDARAVVAEKLRTPRAHGIQLVRTNGLGTPHARADFAVLDDIAVDAIMIPKAEPQPLLGIGPSGPPVIALIETAGGLRRAHEIATRIPRVAALMLGNIDLAAELGATPGPDGRELLFARSTLVVDSAAAGLGGPIDGPCTAIGDDEALRAETVAAKALGFAAKVCIHPNQIAVVHDVFTPTDDELAWARRVVAAADAARGRGAIAVDGQMVDAPVVARSRRLLANSNSNSNSSSNSN